MLKELTLHSTVYLVTGYSDLRKGIEGLVVGRKNWLFSTSPKGAKAGAIIYSLAATAVANGLNVEEYFTELCQMKQILPWKEEPNHDPQA